MSRFFIFRWFVGWLVLAGPFAPSANAEVYYLGRIDELSAVFKTDNAGSGDHVTEAPRNLPSNDTLSVTKMIALPEISTWAMMLLWSIGVALSLVRWPRTSSIGVLAEMNSPPTRESLPDSILLEGAAVVENGPAQPIARFWELPKGEK